MLTLKLKIGFDNGFRTKEIGYLLQFLKQIF